MTATYEDSPIELDPSNFISLAELDSAGIGTLYEINGCQLEPFALYMGDGVFKGLRIESRPGVLSLRIGVERHHDSKPGSTLFALSEIDVSVDIEDEDQFKSNLVDMLIEYYSPDNPSSIPYSLEYKELKLRQLKELKAGMFD